MSSHILDTAIGGIIAIAGTIVAQWFGLFASKVERQHKHAALQRERLEKISDCVGECVEWSQLSMNAKSVAELRDMHLPPGARQMVMLAKIHFRDSDLVPAGIAYMNSLIRFHVLALSSFRGDAPQGTTIGQMLYLEPQKMEQIDAEQFSLRNRIDDAIAKEANKYEPSA
jgi:hypothetical protein